MTRARVPAVVLSLAAATASFALASSALAVNEHPKGGDFQANFKLGPAIKASRAADTQFALQLEISGAIVEDDGYLGFAPQFQFGDYALINLPVSFQYDIKLPVKNLYIYPRIEAGLAMAPDEGADGYYAFTLQPEFGVKYQFHENFHGLIEPLGLPMYFGDPVFLQYRIYFGVGADF